MVIVWKLKSENVENSYDFDKFETSKLLNTFESYENFETSEHSYHLKLKLKHLNPFYFALKLQSIIKFRNNLISRNI